MRASASIETLSQDDAARPAWATAYLAALRNHCTTTTARCLADVRRREVEALERRDEQFRDECEHLIDRSNSRLEVFADQLALGTNKENDGVKYDAGMLRFLLKARMPEIYGTRPRPRIKAAQAQPITDTDPPIADRGCIP